MMPSHNCFQNSIKPYRILREFKALESAVSPLCTSMLLDGHVRCVRIGDESSVLDHLT